MLRFISLFVFSEHCVQDGQQFTHTVNQRHFFGFSGCWQMHVKRLYHRIKPGYHKRCHVQGCSCLRTRTGVVRPADMCGILQRMPARVANGGSVQVDCWSDSSTTRSE